MIIKNIKQFNRISIFGLFVLMIAAGIVFNKTSGSTVVREYYPMVIQGQVTKETTTETVDLLKNIPIKLKEVSTGKIIMTTTSDKGLYNFITSLSVGDYELFNTKVNIYFKFKFYPSEDIANTAITINLSKRSKTSYSNQAVFAGGNGQIYGLDSAIDVFQTSDYKFDNLSLPFSADIGNIILIGNSPNDILITTPNQIYKSTSGGAIWSEVTPEKIPGNIPPSHGLIQTDNGAFITFISGEKVFVSANKGETWKKIAFIRPEGEGAPILSGYFSSLSSGKILLSSSVFSTSNGGASWTKEPTDDEGYYKYYCQKPPSKEDLAKEDAITHKKSYNSWNPKANPPQAFGENGLYQEYDPATNTWKNKPANTEWCLYSTSKTKAGLTYLGGMGLVKRQEGSGRFAPMQSVSGFVGKIEMMDNLKGFLVAGVVYKTTDGWVNKKVENLDDILDIAVVKDGRSPATVTVPPIKLPNIWLYGSNGMQFSRRDNLENYILSPIEWAGNITDLAMKTAANKVEQIGFSIGKDKSGKNKLLRTEEGGYSWRLMESPECENVYGVEMFNDTSVVIQCNDNEIKFSSDRGNTFKKIEVPVSTESEIEWSNFMIRNDYIVFHTDHDELIYGYLDNNGLILKKDNNALGSDTYGVNNTGQVFAFTTKGVFRSQINKSDTILDWVQISPKDLLGISFPIIVFDNTSILIVSNNKLNYSSDNGEHWSELNTGEIDVSTIRSVAIVKDEIILLSDNGTKKIIYYSIDKGISWSATGNRVPNAANIVVVE